MPGKPYLFVEFRPGQHGEVIALAREVEARGFPGIFLASHSASRPGNAGVHGDNVALALAVLDHTERITVGTGIASIYLRHVHIMAAGASIIADLHPGRFILGLGLSHAPFHDAMGVAYGRPLKDMRRYVESLRTVIGNAPLPPVLIAAMRRKMTRLAGTIGDGVMWSSAVRSHLPRSLDEIPAERRPLLILANSIPTCVADDRAAALAVIRRYMLLYLQLPNYQNYYIEAGYEAEIATARAAIERGDDAGIMAALTEEMAADIALFGTPAEVRAQAEAWEATGLTHLVLHTVSTTGDPDRGLQEALAAFD